MANNTRVIHGAIALIKVQGITVGKMRSINAQESYSRQDVQGLGTIFTSEAPATKFTGTVSCEFMSVDFTREGIQKALRRNFKNIQSQVSNGAPSFEDQLVLDSDRGVQIDIFKKIEDLIDANGNIIPKAVPYAVIQRCLIDSDSFSVSEGSIGSHNQSFRYLDPIIEV